MWFVLLAVYSFEIFCIFVFVVYCVVTFLMIMYQTRTEELRKCIAPDSKNLEAELPVEVREIVDDNLEVLTEKLTEKERVLQQSHYEIKSAEKVLSDLEQKTSSCRDRYKSLMSDLKKDVRKTEEEVKTLQNQISSLSVRREVFRNEALKQQEDYQKMLNNFTKELEHKKALFSPSSGKSRQPRVSCLALK
ncbi:uncharacterized protein LOC122403702 [Colletes gigas]|uniref:uncharacterized protein LOC122403702 n=1 Tax=Colletes gigas TaxID=935657 RepID=UPI001C9AEAE5|nr:uncharacterized protein LOC122403702 [Colletes gigas]